MRSKTGIQVSKSVRAFLELAQPLPVEYGYSRGVKQKSSYVTYKDAGTTPTRSIGGYILSERRTYMVTVQTKTAEENLYYSMMIKYASEGTFVEFMSDDLRKDVTVASGWINTIILSVYNVVEETLNTYTAEEVRFILQDVADNYLFVTSVYGLTLDDSFLDSMVVPELPQEVYTYNEMIALKRQYLDKLVLLTTEF